MYGFIGTWMRTDYKINTNHFFYDNNSKVKSVKYNEISICSKSNGKFDGDKILLEDKDIIICII